jgi:hypothetical protein
MTVARPIQSMPDKIKVVERKLGQHRAYGLHWPGEIHIDTRLKPKKRLEVVIHEYMHEICPEWDEKHVTEQAVKMSDFLWTQGYRRRVTAQRRASSQGDA